MDPFQGAGGPTAAQIAQQRRISIRQVALDIYKYGVHAHLPTKLQSLTKAKTAEDEDVEPKLRIYARHCLQASEIWHDLIDEEIEKAQRPAGLHEEERE